MGGTAEENSIDALQCVAICVQICVAMRRSNYCLQMSVRTNALDETHPPTGRMGSLSNGRKQSWKELVREDKDQEGRVPAGLGEVGHRHHIGGKLDARKVLDVLVGLVDDLRELSLGRFAFVVVGSDVHHFLKDPHVDPRFVKGQSLAVPTHNGRNGRAPVPAANDADLVELVVGILGIRRGVGGEGGVVHGIGHLGIVCSLCVVVVGVNV